MEAEPTKFREYVIPSLAALAGLLALWWASNHLLTLPKSAIPRPPAKVEPKQAEGAERKQREEADRGQAASTPEKQPEQAERKPAAGKPEASTLEDLPALVLRSDGKADWHAITGLHVAAATPGRGAAPALRLRALPTAGRHLVAVQVLGLTPSATYRIVGWFAKAPGGHLMIEVRDGADATTGQPAHYGFADFDLGNALVTRVSGDVRSAGIAPDGDGWMKAWVDLPSRDGSVFAVFGILEGPSNNHVFQGTGQEIVFGGAEVQRQS
ncbi:MAG TPA: hypothetical protein VFA64_04430 [Hyphomicrobiaceae bacterium]|nr:hypothetical protein [Hyphomicrobiaceae bacterium]